MVGFTLVFNNSVSRLYHLCHRFLLFYEGAASCEVENAVTGFDPTGTLTGDTGYSEGGRRSVTSKQAESLTLMIHVVERCRIGEAEEGQAPPSQFVAVLVQGVKNTLKNLVRDYTNLFYSGATLGPQMEKCPLCTSVLEPFRLQILQERAGGVFCGKGYGAESASVCPGCDLEVNRCFSTLLVLDSVDHGFYWCELCNSAKLSFYPGGEGVGARICWPWLSHAVLMSPLCLYCRIPMTMI